VLGSARKKTLKNWEKRDAAIKTADAKLGNEGVDGASSPRRGDSMRATATVLARVEDQKFHKAVEGIRNGAYQMKITRRTQQEVRGFVKKGDGKEYGCTITEAGAWCSCPDALYRGGICKHAVALALDVIRTPGIRTEQEEPRR